MNHIKIIRHPNEIGTALLEAKYTPANVDKAFSKITIEKLFEQFAQIAYCVETGEVVAAVDKDGYLQVVIPEYITL